MNGTAKPAGLCDPVEVSLHDVEQELSRQLRGLAEAPLVGHGIHLQDDAVRLEGHVVTLCSPFAEEGEDPIHIGDDRAMGIDGKRDFFEE